MLTNFRWFIFETYSRYTEIPSRSYKGITSTPRLHCAIVVVRKKTQFVILCSKGKNTLSCVVQFKIKYSSSASFFELIHSLCKYIKYSALSNICNSYTIVSVLFYIQIEYFLRKHAKSIPVLICNNIRTSMFVSTSASERLWKY